MVVTGMHRSGTSLAAAFVGAAGVDMGRELLAGDAANPRGYFEDTELLAFQRDLLARCCPPGDAGWPDWGWTEAERLDRGALVVHRAAAERLVETRRGRASLWGWKDPRTSLLLDFWDALLPEACYVFVYRPPWDVADSMRRLNAAVFTTHPDWAPRIWAYYNRHVLEFHRAHVDRCVLVEATAVKAAPAAVFALLRDKLGLPLGERPSATEAVVDPALLVTHTCDDAFLAEAPECAQLLAALEAAADLPAPAGRSRAAVPRAAPAGRHRPGVALSIIVPCFNQGQFILDAIASVEECRDPVYEVVIVNDGSDEPHTQDVLAGLRARGYFVLDQPNQGLAAARNAGIAAAHGRYLLALDADNRITSAYVTKGIAVLDADPAVGVVYGNAEWFGARSGLWEVGPFEVKHLLLGNFIDACAVFRRELWERAGGYDASIPDKLGWEDWDLWLSAVEQGWKFHYLPEVLFSYRVRSDSMSARCGIPANRRRLMTYLVGKHPALYVPRFAETFAEKDFSLAVEEIRGREALAATQAHATHLAAERDQTRAETRRVEAEAAARVAAIGAEMERLGGERDGLRSLLEQEREIRAFMEQTRAWRLRGRVLQLRHGIEALLRREPARSHGRT